MAQGGLPCAIAVEPHARALLQIFPRCRREGMAGRAWRLARCLINLCAQPHLAQHLFDVACALNLRCHQSAGAGAGDVFGKVVEE